MRVIAVAPKVLELHDNVIAMIHESGKNKR
jgi:hypothetical protein